MSTQPAPTTAAPEVRSFDVTRVEVSSETWERTDTHCPTCGAHGAWRQSDSHSMTDVPHLCSVCGAHYWLTLARRDLKEDAQRLGHLRINQRQDRRERHAPPELNWRLFADTLARIYLQPGRAFRRSSPASPENSAPALEKTPSQQQRTHRQAQRQDQPTRAATPHRPSSSPRKKTQSTPRGGRS